MAAVQTPFIVSRLQHAHLVKKIVYHDLSPLSLAFIEFSNYFVTFLASDVPKDCFVCFGVGDGFSTFFS